MLRSRAIVVRVRGERDELVREARRLLGLVDSLPHLPEPEEDEALDELAAAAREIDQIGRLAGSLDGAAAPEERATVKRLRALGRDARLRRRALRRLRQRLLDEHYYLSDGESAPNAFEPYDGPLAADERLAA